MSAELDDVLKEVKAGTAAPLYLLWGEEFLVRKAADALVGLLVPDAAVGFNFAVMDGASPREVAQELATLPMFPGRKVVLVRDPEFLAPKKGRGDALGRARDAWKAGRKKEAARRVLALAARAGWGARELDPSASGAPSAEAWKRELDVDLAEADMLFLREVAAFCLEERVTAPEGDTTALTDLFAKELPPGHVLVLAATDVDAKNPLVKLARESGRVVERKVASKLKELDLTALTTEVLRPLKKRLGAGAEERLKDRCGGNMRLVHSELEKLALYVEGSVIEAEDVELLVGRAREEEYMELADALQRRDLQAALRYVEDAMGHGSHGLQLLGAVASVVRGLLENQDRLDRHARGSAPRSYDDFKTRVWPGIEREAKEEKGRAPHPWGAFQGMQAAARYGRQGLLRSLVACAEADLALKSSAGGKLVLERLLWTVCGQA
ncbi:MAG: DNA polymerase III subunit delta [Myxococcaceae bacterium]|nr:DNA polymerase III subunit delta [Myxococcaceae bacterium]MCI0670560.1 DNA polymerase III subunit delta [Myxococcaceae bacterium]